jgi:CRISPR-associated endonuclease/helicase Cas3
MNPTFSDVFSELYGYKPYPWQRRLVEALPKTSQIKAETGAGKTCTIDVWLYNLACEAGTPIGERRTPLKMAYTINRRLVVDSTYDHAKKIQETLEVATAQTPALQWMREQLLKYGGDQPLAVSRLRGGTPSDRDWYYSPLQPTILISTIDHLGSRLLFRAYGHRRQIWPIQAGLLGHDTLIILDESHVSMPFTHTLQSIQAYRERGALKTPWQVIEMSATVIEGAAAYSTSAEDWEHPVLGPRLANPKRAWLQRVEKRADLVPAMVKAAKERRGQVIGVIANTVSDARTISKKLESKAVDVVLLTGRIRPLERQAILDTWLDLIKSGRDQDPEKRLYIVATQSIEIGADLDFDALVTMSASLSALRQRVGRLNRTARLSVADLVIIHGPDMYVYGDLAENAMAWLASHAIDGVIDMSPISLAALAERTPMPDEPVEASYPLVADDIDMLSQTSHAYPVDISDYLHGIRRSTDVTVIWRDDLPIDEPQQWPDIVDLMRPRVSVEGIEVPVGTARQWLASIRPNPISDLGDADVSQLPKRLPHEKVALAYGDDPKIIGPRDVAPGMVLIVPSAYGGHDQYGWDTSSTEFVPDCAEWACRQYGRVRQRVTTDRIKELHHVLSDWQRDRRNPELTPREYEEIDEQFASTCAGVLNIEGPLRVTEHPDGAVLWQPTGIDLTDEDALSYTGEPRSLEAHSLGVSQWICHSCNTLGLPFPISHIAMQSGEAHDVGKAAFGFQLMLWGNGSVGGTVLAKSALPNDRTLRRAAWQASRLPRGWRHEVVSAQMLPDGVPDMARHLVASHHGYCRPHPPLVDHGDEIVEFSLNGVRYRRDLDKSDNFAARWETLRNEYGAYGLAYLEAIVRLADWADSAAAARTPSTHENRLGSRSLQSKPIQLIMEV